MPRPLIGVTTQTLQAIDGIPEGLPNSVVMNQRYYHAAAMAGAAPLLIPLMDDLETLRAVYERMDGILIPGGVDSPVRAFRAVCTHEGCTITGADADIYVCPCHGSRYSRSGKVVNGPATSSLRKYATTFADGIVTIAL